ncbi:uncharacterized protein LOC117343891 [Pecten maximus]|uniref:uncharacterized protein LOC117343891 n=1 Tax=Pecten maximus TaxID=6579 RepID=UPI0014584547|nr:uncharacterized protein LOC117343891 [Pecten maximus]
MVKYCCVPECTGSGGHKFPRDSSLLRKWRVAIQRTDLRTKGIWSPSPEDVVCKAHFQQSDYKETLLGERGRLKDGVVPSVFPFRPTSVASPREKRQQKRVENSNSPGNGTILDSLMGDVQQEVELPPGNIDDIIEIPSDDTVTETFASTGAQCNIIGDCRIQNYSNNPKGVQYWTGFAKYHHFMFVFNCLGPAARDLNYKCTSLSAEDQFFLTMIKLRQGSDDFELSEKFSVSETTVSKVVITWINFLYFQLKELPIWPTRDTVTEHMPIDFGKKFKSTRVILDATEVPIQKPSHVQAQSLSWSSYKHRNTVKTMIGCTPRGAVSYVSQSYGGSASDRQIIENSELLDPQRNLFERGDSIMADRGIMVQDLFATHDVHVNTPSMLKGKTQLEPEEVSTLGR